jgi:hypothetical protein
VLRVTSISSQSRPVVSQGARKDVELATQRCVAVGDVEEVAGVGVASHERQSALLAHATDQNARPGNRSWFVDGSREVVVRTSKLAAVTGPLLCGEAQEFLEAAIPLGRGGERQPGHGRFVVAVADADTQPGPAT